MSVAYSTHTRLAAARAVLSALTYDDQKKALDHWGVFDSHPMNMRADENEFEYVERAFGALRIMVLEWMTDYRLSEIESRLEVLENPDGGQLSNHR